MKIILDMKKVFSRERSRTICVLLSSLMMLLTYLVFAALYYWDFLFFLYQPDLLRFVLAGVPLCLAMCLSKEPRKWWQALLATLFCVLNLIINVSLHFSLCGYPFSGVYVGLLATDGLILLSFLGYLFFKPYKEISK